MSEFSDWIGRETVRVDVATAAPLRGLAALLDRPGLTADLLPPLAHWLFFLPDALQSTLGADGHPRLGCEMPDLGLSRRMWAGSRLTFIAPLMVGARMVRRTRIVSITRKEGASGPLAFVLLRHEIEADGSPALVEEQDIVYRSASNRVTPASTPVNDAPAPDAVIRERTIDSSFLFRFSALTFNAHRIHYDRDYAREFEGYPGLVVHGPLQAMLLMDLFRCAYPERSISQFRFSAHAPLFDGEPAAFGIEPTPEGAKLWVRARARQTMSATVTGSSPRAIRLGRT